MNGLLAALTSYLLPCILITLLPGPDTMVVLQAAASGGRRHGIQATLGVTLGLVTWSAVIGLGLGVILAANSVALLLFKAVCCIYLIYLSWRALRASREAASSGVAQQRFTRPFAKSYGTCVLNPKLGAFFVAVLPQFIPPQAAPGPTAAALVLLQGAVALAWYSVVTSVATKLAATLAKPSTSVWLNRLSAAIFLGFAVRLIID